MFRFTEKAYDMVPREKLRKSIVAERYVWVDMYEDSVTAVRCVIGMMVGEL